MDKDLIEKVARAICLTNGQDPDDYAPLTIICGPNNQALPYWRVFEEEAQAAISTLAPMVLDMAAGLITEHADAMQKLDAVYSPKAIRGLGEQVLAIKEQFHAR